MSSPLGEEHHHAAPLVGLGILFGNNFGLSIVTGGLVMEKERFAEVIHALIISC